MTPLPLIDGCFLVDNSAIEKLKCPRLYEYAEFYRKTSTAEKAGANYGSAIHRGLETRYKLCGVKAVDLDAEGHIVAAMQQWLAENPQPENDFRTYARACQHMRVYNHIYRNEGFKLVAKPDGSPLVEASFCLPFAVFWTATGIISSWDGKGIETIKSSNGIPVFYCGKIDLAIEDHNGIWSQDHKTAFQFGVGFDQQMSVDAGQRGYVWALRETIGRPVAGYIIDAIRVRRPAKGEEFSGEYAIDATDFKRTPYFVSPAEIEEWRTDTLAIIRNIFFMHANGHFPKFRANCTNKYGTCEFFDVCNCPVEQRERILESGLFTENTWCKGLKTEAEKQNQESQK